MMKEALLIFAKNPEYGKVKTRLASTIGDAQALFIYEQFFHFIPAKGNPRADRNCFVS